MNALISVIVPVYNGERFLVDCIESIINQSLKNIQVIFINDGSTDNSLNILKRYAQNDNRIKIVNQSNSGPSFARNVGINLATGEYISFVDADDWIDKDMFEKMYGLGIKNNADIVICEAIRELGDLKIKDFNFDVSDEHVFDKNYIHSNIIPKFLKSNKFNSMADKIYKRETMLKNNIKWDIELVYGEDWKFNIDFFKNADKGVYIHKGFYHYRRGHVSSTSKYKSNYLDKVGIFLYRERKKYAVEMGFNKFIGSYELFNVVLYSIISESFGYGNTNVRNRFKNIKEIVSNAEVREAVENIDKSLLSLSHKICVDMIVNKRILGLMTYAYLGKLKSFIYRK